MRRSRLLLVLAGALVVAIGSSVSGAAPPAAVELPLKDAKAGPSGIAAGPDGNLWFTEQDANKIGRITPTGTVDEFPLETAARPLGIAAGPDGNLWFTENVAGKIGRITPTGTVDEFPLKDAKAGPLGIAAGPDGNLWFTEYSANKIGRITPTGTVDEFKLSTPFGTTAAGPLGIAAGPDGNLWFTENVANKIGRITPAGTVEEFDLKTAAGPFGIAAGPDGNLWFTENDAGKIGRITPAGTLLDKVPLPTAAAGPFGIAVGPDGNLWFTEVGANKIGRITPAGAVEEFELKTANAQPVGIAAGPDGSLWFTEGGAGKIGRVATEAAAPLSGNLLRNPGFETGTIGTGLTATPVPGWATTPNLTTARYGAFLYFPATAVAATLGGGRSFAVGGPNTSQSHALQLVDVARHAQAIDEGRATVTLAGLLGGKADDPDSGTLTATFLSDTGEPLGSLQIGPVNAAARDNQTTLLPRSRSVPLLPGTRTIRVDASATRRNGNYLDASFDNLSLTLATTAKPAPTTTTTPKPKPTPTPKRDTTAPALTRLTLSPRAFTAQAGATLRYRLTEPATLTLVLTRALPGRRHRGACVAPANAAANAARCTRRVKAATLTLSGKRGPNSTHLNPRNATTPLPPGRYQLTATATDTAGNRTRTTTTLTIRA